MLKIKSKVVLSTVIALNTFFFSISNSYAEEVKLDDETSILDETKKDNKKDNKAKKNAKIDKKDNEDEDSLDDLLNTDINAGGTGSFGYLLDKATQDLGLDPYIHAYTTFDAIKANSDPFTFNLKYYNLFFGVNIKDLISTELQIENENGGSEYNVRVGQVDLLANPLLNFRFGKFLVPIGSFNSFIYPEYITKAVVRPFALREIVPVAWSEVGVELFGKYDFGINKNVSYNLYVVNGLKRTGVEKGADVKDGAIRTMRDNNIEAEKSDKGFGGRLGISPIDGLDISVSAYTGFYTPDSSKRISIGDVDLAYELGGFALRGEYVYALQQLGSSDVTKNGGYGQVSYLFKQIEPVLRYEQISFSNEALKNRQRILAGINYYPTYDVYKKFVMKFAYGYTMQQEIKDPNAFYFQTSLGF